MIDVRVKSYNALMDSTFLNTRTDATGFFVRQMYSSKYADLRNSDDQIIVAGGFTYGELKAAFSIIENIEMELSGFLSSSYNSVNVYHQQEISAVCGFAAMRMEVLASNSSPDSSILKDMRNAVNKYVNKIVNRVGERTISHYANYGKQVHYDPDSIMTTIGRYGKFVESQTFSKEVIGEIMKTRYALDLDRRKGFDEHVARYILRWNEWIKSLNGIATNNYHIGIANSIA